MAGRVVGDPVLNAAVTKFRVDQQIRVLVLSGYLRLFTRILIGETHLQNDVLYRDW
jgi:hypothetical protein